MTPPTRARWQELDWRRITLWREEARELASIEDREEDDAIDRSRGMHLHDRESWSDE